MDEQSINERFSRLEKTVDDLRNYRTEDTGRLARVETKVDSIYVIVDQLNKKMDETSKKPEKRLDVIFKSIVGFAFSVALIIVGIYLGK